MENVKINRQNGITLIALVITIIVLIILAGVAISMLSGDNGILNQAASAKQQTEEQSELEQVKLAATASMINENHKVDKEQLDKELANYGLPAAGGDETSGYTLAGNKNNYIIASDGTVTVEGGGGEDIPVVTEPPTTKVTEKTKFQDTTSDNKIAVIPEGFRVSSEAGEQSIDGGLVVIAPDESEFVWVPVTNINSMYGTDADGNKLGKLYKFTDANTENNTAYNWTETDGVMSWTKTSGSGSYREPDILEDTSFGDASTTANQGLNLLSSIIGIEGEVGTDNDAMLATWKNQLQDEFDAMIESVRLNGGFYVGRYETSLSSSGNAQSIQGATSATAANANTWYGLYQREKEYSEKNSLSSVVGSSMIWGSQYDQMLIWMQKNDINVASSTPIPNASRNQDRTTGTHDADKLNNIYDILGNSREWTLEANNTSNRVSRRRRLQLQHFASLPRRRQSVQHRIHQFVSPHTLCKVELNSKSDKLLRAKFKKK